MWNGIRHERIRRIMKMGEISKKVQENKLKWYAHEMSTEEEEYVGKKSDGDGCAGDGKED